MSTDFPRWLNSLTRLLNLLAALLLLGLMLLTVADVIGRNWLGGSILGSVDISTLLLVGIAFLGLATAEITGKHVSVTLVDDNVGPRTRTVFSIVRLIALAVLGVLMVYGLAESAYSAYERQETTNAILLLPTWQTKVVLCVSFLLFFVAALIREAGELRGWLREEPA
ncbi:hypothetical protein C3B44_08480 [Corynebacterium yudongzhengii]|uniref:TRAP transporter small permease n=1 Tax=Corynebacterium yudongzhengii TaxID=2080740 RepID=A0A2U1T428_9CORY|nr:TRAP transporter small permease [Corynebacterium yudongzhengii]AWB82382.1 hypothetical protein C3B44_08480 [Corynebacterium yudongzhengii]PWC00766.1 TRAP transporter small permease [Corynebacterium yudongzhengii]